MDPRGLFTAVAARTVLSHEESADLTRAVVEALAGQLSESEARRLAADLPGLLTEQLQAPRRRRKGAHPIQVGDFVRQVSKRTGLTDGDARSGAGAVLAVLREELGEEEYSHVIGQLPAEYAGLAGKTG